MPSRGRSPPLQVIDGLSEANRDALASEGITRVGDLVETPPDRVAEIAEPDSPDRAVDWVDEARRLSAVVADREEDLPVELVDGIGPTFGRQLRDDGVTDLDALADPDAEEVAERASTPDVTVSTDRARRWQKRARSMLDALDELETIERETIDRERSDAETVNTDLGAGDIVTDRLGSDESAESSTDDSEPSAEEAEESTEKSSESTEETEE